MSPVLVVLAMLAASPPSPAKAELQDDDAARFAELALACIGREYPNKLAHTLAGDTDVKPPRDLTPAFFGCYDWHSAVHGHWLLVRLLRLNPKAEWASRTRVALGVNLTAAKLLVEARYLSAEGRASFERPYGLAWLLALCAELREWVREGTDAKVFLWLSALRPLEDAVAKRLLAWLPKLTFPVRSGEHSQTAFALSLVLDWSRTAALDPDSAAQAKALGELARERARAFYLHDTACPLSYEPSGEDFLSPCLSEADAMRRALPAAELGPWMEKFFPGASLESLKPAVVSDPADPKLAHLDGLNLSRAFMLEGIAAALGEKSKLTPTVRAAALAHRTAGLAAVTGKHYEGGHWLGSFATYLVTRRGLPAK